MRHSGLIQERDSSLTLMSSLTLLPSSRLLTLSTLRLEATDSRSKTSSKLSLLIWSGTLLKKILLIYQKLRLWTQQCRWTIYCLKPRLNSLGCGRVLKLLLDFVCVRQSACSHSSCLPLPHCRVLLWGPRDFYVLKGSGVFGPLCPRIQSHLQLR